MVEGPGTEHGNKIKVTVTIHPELYEWVMDQTGAGREFSGISHGVERGIRCLMDEDDESG